MSSIHRIIFYLLPVSVILFSVKINAQEDTSRVIVQRIMKNNGSVVFGRIQNSIRDSVNVNLLNGPEIKIPAVDIKNVSGEIEISGDRLYRFALTDGSELIGYVKAIHDSTFNFLTTGDVKAYIPIAKVFQIEQTKMKTSEKSGKLKYGNRSRLFLSATARPLGAGEGYISDYMIFFPYVAVGLTDFIDIGGGISLFPNARYELLYGGLKVAFLRMRSLDMAAGVFWGGALDSQTEGEGMMYAVTTYGNEARAFTFGFGRFFNQDGEFGAGNVFIIGGELKVSSSAKLITENWIFAEPDGRNSSTFLSLGVRFFSKNFAGDFGLFYSLANTGGGFPFIPWLSITYNF